jgi:2-hydroxychromene-2-carboxylate isomerase
LEDEAVLKDCLTEAGVNVDEIIALSQSKEIKAALQATTDDAIEKGVFGLPTMFVDGQMYWGADRWHLIADQLNEQV